MLNAVRLGVLLQNFVATMRIWQCTKRAHTWCAWLWFGFKQKITRDITSYTESSLCLAEYPSCGLILFSQNWLVNSQSSTVQLKNMNQFVVSSHQFRGSFFFFFGLLSWLMQGTVSLSAQHMTNTGRVSLAVGWPAGRTYRWLICFCFLTLHATLFASQLRASEQWRSFYLFWLVSTVTWLSSLLSL